MNKLSIFLILLIFGCVIFGCTLNNKESFSVLQNDCSTLRCKNNKYSATSMKNTFNNKFTSSTSGHIANIKNSLSNFKESWL